MSNISSEVQFSHTGNNYAVKYEIDNDDFGGFWFETLTYDNIDITEIEIDGQTVERDLTNGEKYAILDEIKKDIENMMESYQADAERYAEDEEMNGINITYYKGPRS